jgi:hypothetical protein
MAAFGRPWQGWPAVLPVFAGASAKGKEQRAERPEGESRSGWPVLAAFGRLGRGVGAGGAAGDTDVGRCTGDMVTSRMNP